MRIDLELRDRLSLPATGKFQNMVIDLAKPEPGVLPKARLFPPPRWISEILASPALRTMGHGQRAEDGNLGLGWMYYALARVLRPALAVVIGSYRGFVPLILAHAPLEVTLRR